ncbi:hypothetical protein D3C76_1725790 [compost metagenome]
MQNLLFALRRHFGQLHLPLLDNKQRVRRLLLHYQRLAFGVFPVPDHRADPRELPVTERGEDRHFAGTRLRSIFTGMFRHSVSLLGF